MSSRRDCSLPRWRCVCLVLFVRGTVDGPEKAASNRIYRICGWTIIVSIGLIGLLFATGLDDTLARLRPVFWLETAATSPLATSWRSGATACAR